MKKPMILKINRIALCVTIIIATVFIIQGCSSGNKRAGAKTIITIATLNGPSAISMVKMMQDSILSDSAIMKFIIKTEPNLVKPMILQEQADIAILPTNMASILFNLGAKYKIAVIPVWGTLYVFGQDSTVKKWQNLKGKKVYLMGRGMTPDIMFRYLLTKNGLKPDKDFFPDYSFPTHLELGNAVAAGKAGLAVLSEPMVTIANSRNPKVKRLLSLEDEWNRVSGDSIPFAQTALLIKNSFAENHPALVKALVEKYKESINWVNTNPALAANLIVQFRIMPDSALAMKTIPGCRLEFREAWPMKSGINRYLKVFYDFDPVIVGGKLPANDFYLNIDALN
jgi:NitT/TauT family transport system substrate-binding protein